jgi:outer membrane protein
MKIFLSMLLSIFFLSPPAFAVTVDDAVKMALEVSLVMQEQDQVVKRSQFSYISTIDPYLPRIDISTSYNRSLHNVLWTIGGAAISGNSVVSNEMYAFTGTISYRLFDGGERYAKRMGAFYVVEREKERYKTTRVETTYSAKSKFWTALGKKDVVEKRLEAYNITKRIFDLTSARFAEGVAKKSDVLQAEVRMTTARIEHYNAQKDFEKALNDLKSLLFVIRDDRFNVEGDLSAPIREFDRWSLVDRALRTRPDVAAQTKEVDRLDMIYVERRSAWFPKIDAQLTQSRQDKTFYPDNRQDIFTINLTFPLFDGVGRYYNMKAASSDVQAARFKLGEIRRTAELEIARALIDYDLSRQDVKSYTELLREATSNFNQAYGEYQYGKGDILGLLQAERDLAKAKENLVNALYLSNNALANVERVAYLSGM